MTLSVALTFCVLSASIVMVACIKRFQAVKSEKRRRQKIDQQETDRESREREDEDKKKVCIVIVIIGFGYLEWGMNTIVKNYNFFETFFMLRT